jgi:hypothetical protein
MVGADGLGSKEDVRVFNSIVLAQFVWRASSAAIPARRPQVVAPSGSNAPACCAAEPRARTPSRYSASPRLIARFEEGAESSVADGDGENEAVYEIQRLIPLYANKA